LIIVILVRKERFPSVEERLLYAKTGGDCNSDLTKTVFACTQGEIFLGARVKIGAAATALPD